MPYHLQVHGPLDASSCACFLWYRGMVRMHVHVYATVLNSLSTYAATTVVTLFFFLLFLCTVYTSTVRTSTGENYNHE